MTKAPAPDPRLGLWKPAALLPTGEMGQSALRFVIATLCFLAALCALASLACGRAADGWGRQIRSEVTVQVRPNIEENSSAIAARAAETLAAEPGVIEAEALNEAKAKALLKPWLGDIDVKDLPLPHLVAVKLKPERPATATQLAQALKRANIDATVDDHGQWLKEIEAAADRAQWFALGAFVLVALAAGAMVTFATRAGLSAQKDVVEVLYLSGATDDFIANLFLLRFARLAFEAGILASLAAMILWSGLKLIGGHSLTPVLPIAWIDLAWLLFCPLLAATIAAVSARATTIHLLRTTEAL